jgi:hypothetical protein
LLNYQPGANSPKEFSMYAALVAVNSNWQYCGEIFYFLFISARAGSALLRRCGINVYYLKQNLLLVQ